MASYPSLNRRAVQVETEQDLLRDQLNFFRTSNALPDGLQVDDNDNDDQVANALANLNTTSNATKIAQPAISETVTERKVSRRTRRLRNPNAAHLSRQTGFPPSSGTSIATWNLARHSQEHRNKDTNIQSQAANNRPAPSIALVPDSISEETKEAFAAMSAEEVRAAQKEILSNLKPDSIHFLRQRWKERISAHPSVPQSENESQHQLTKSLTSNLPDPPLKEDTTLNNNTSSQRPHGDLPAHTIRPDSYKQPSSIVKSSQSVNASHFKSAEPRQSEETPPPLIDASVGPEAEDQHIVSEILIPTDEDPNAEEVAKRAWMTTADQPVQCQPEVDQLLAKAIENMGDIGSKRFDLDGAALTLEQIQSLPTHLGLHHHGSSPGDAGYTIPDVLVLTRSTVVTQRILALRMLTAMIKNHGRSLKDVLVSSGGLALVFAPFPSISTFQTSVTNQLTFVEAVQAFVSKDERLLADKLDSALYFTSRFYSPSPLKSSPLPEIEIITQSDCLPILCQIAAAASIRNPNSPVAIRALQLIRTLVLNNDNACIKILEDQVAVRAVQRLACDHTAADARTILLSCDILATVAVSTGWAAGAAQKRLKQTVLDEHFLRRLSNHLILMIHEGLKPLTDKQRFATTGALRVFRAALTFQSGMQVVTDCAQPISRLMHEDGQTGIEAYFTFESYAHSLYTMLTDTDTDDDPDSGLQGTSSQQNEAFAKDQLSSLIPIAISAVRSFVGLTSQEFGERAAAIGHLAATVMITSTVPICDEEHFIRLFNICSQCNAMIKTIMTKESFDISRLQTLASVSHAGARLLTRIKLDDAYVAREVHILVEAAEAEREMLSRQSCFSERRPMANAAAEWICLQGRTSRFKKTLEIAVQILPCLRDARAAIDVLSRTVFNARVLHGMNPSTPLEKVQTCAREVLLLLLSILSEPSEHSKVHASGNESRKSDNALFDIKILLEKVISSCDTGSSVLIVTDTLQQLSCITSTLIFESLLHASGKWFSEDFLRALFSSGRASVVGQQPLIDFKTTHNSAFTTIQDDGQRKNAKWKTALSAVSTSVDPVLARCILSLCEHLVNRGPFQGSAQGDGTITVDHVASVVLNLMYSDDVDGSLKRELWKRSISDCGGAALYAHAVFWTPEGCFPHLEYYHFFDLVGTSLLQNHLDPERCPKVLRGIIVRSLAADLRTRKRNIWDDLLPSGTSAQKRTVASKLQGYLDAEDCSAASTEIQAIQNWLRNQGMFRDSV